MLGVVLICGGGLGAVYLTGADSPAPTPDDDSVAVAPSPVVPPVLAGRTLTAASLAPGMFPPSLAPGALVRVIAVGGPDPLDASVRAFSGEAVVEDVSGPHDGSSDVVVTLSADESLGDFVAGAGTIRLTIVGTIS